jgi:hypothetical protein
LRGWRDGCGWRAGVDGAVVGQHLDSEAVKKSLSGFRSRIKTDSTSFYTDDGNISDFCGRLGFG